MKYKSLIISNIAETYHLAYKKSEPKKAKQLIQYDFLEAERALFYTDNSKVVITSVSVDSEHLADLHKVFDYQIVNLFPKSPTVSICKDILKEKNLFHQIVTIIQRNPGIALIPYYATSEFFDLIATLKQEGLCFHTPETISPKNRSLLNYYNCKVGFRKLWEKATDKNSFVKIPKGFIVNDLKEALDAAWWFYQQNTNFVFKYNRGTSGFGIIPYSVSDLPKEEKEFKKYLTQRHKNRIWFEENFVVEEHIDIDTSIYGGSPSLEFRINGKVKHVYNSLQRLRPKDNYFEGVIISKEADLQLTFDINRVVKSCFDFAKALSKQGYKGVIDIDLVVDKKHNVYAVESNLRRNGGTHIFETANYFFGSKFSEKMVVASRDNLPVKSEVNSYSQFKKLTASLFFSREKGEGIIPTITSFLSIGTIGYIIFAKNMDRLTEIEKELTSIVSGNR